MKLSGAYMETKVGPPAYADVSKVARAYVKAAPERLIWASDWPHPTEKADAKPDDAILFDLLADWTPGRSDPQSHPGRQSRCALRVQLDHLRVDITIYEVMCATPGSAVRRSAWKIS